MRDLHSHTERARDEAPLSLQIEIDWLTDELVNTEGLSQEAAEHRARLELFSLLAYARGWDAAGAAALIA